MADVAVIINKLTTREKRLRLGLPLWKVKMKLRTRIVINSPQLAILGRQNIGKSTLVNTLLGEEHVIAGEMPGLTRDCIYL